MKPQLQDATWRAGPSIQENHKEAFMKLIRALRRFFAPGAAEEIWAFFRPKLLTMHPDFQEASTV